MDVVSLYDFTGEAVKPWAAMGFDCYCYDIQHDGYAPKVAHPSGGSVSYMHADLHSPLTFAKIERRHRGTAAFLSAFPVCTDLAVSGAAWFEAKARQDPDFQRKAADYAIWCAELGDRLTVPYYVENPVSRLASIWRKPDHYFHPFEYGGYIPDDEAAHPRWPDYIAPRDAYSKKTCLWTGGGFVMPARKPVPCNSFGASDQHRKLGGKSQRTKDIRSATPRGFAIAVCHENHRGNVTRHLGQQITMMEYWS